MNATKTDNDIKIIELKLREIFYAKTRGYAQLSG